MEISMGVYIESRYFDVSDLLPTFCLPLYLNGQINNSRSRTSPFLLSH